MRSLALGVTLVCASYACSSTPAGEPDASIDAKAADSTPTDSAPTDASSDALSCTGDAGTAKTCGGKCVDTASDPANCGACGVACDLTCVASVCGPLVTNVTASAQDLAVDATHVYWREYGSAGAIRTCPLTGCVAGTKIVDVANFPRRGLVVAGSDIYWTESSTVYHCPTTGCVAGITFASDSSPGTMVADGTFLYWTSGTKAINKCALAACTTPTVLTTTVGHTPGQLAIDGSLLVWSNDDGTIESCPTTGCSSPSSVVGSGFGAAWVTAAAGDVFFFSSNSLIAVTDTGATADAGTLAPSEPEAENLVNDGVAAYWANWSASNTGTLKKCALTGCGQSPTVLLDSRNLGDPTTSALKVTATSIVWIEGGNIFAHAK